MTDAFDPRGVPVRDAATVMLVRDGETGLEVFVLRRAMGAVFAGGSYVFPGGRVDLADATDEVAAVCDGLDDVRASGLLDLDAGGLAFWVGAIRECFEEAGVLLATDGEGAVVRFDDADTAARFERYRHAVHDGRLDLVTICREERLRLSAGSIRYVSHWITPLGERRRFDTRFFLAEAPRAQVPLHDDGETIESLWVRPADALDRNHRGELAMLPPTVASLRFLAEHATADDAMTAAAALPSPAPILPKGTFDAEGRFVSLLFPWDAGYDQAPDHQIR